MQNNVELAKYTSFRIGGPAKYFLEAKSAEDFLHAEKFAKENNLLPLVLGSGTNMLIQDEGYKGLVIKNSFKGIEIENDLIIVSTGNLLPEIHNFANKNGFVGFEKLATVPGTLGGALYNNAHWKDDLLSNHLEWVEIIKDGEVKRISVQDLNFAYDTSKFKTDNLIAIRAALRLPKGDTEQSRKNFLEYMKTRSDSQPYGTKNSGCMFQNIQQNLGPGNHGTSAGYLIEQVGMKGYTLGDAMISDKHANFFINKGSAKSQDIIKLAELCKEKVKEKFKVDLEYEIKII